MVYRSARSFLDYLDYNLEIIQDPHIFSEEISVSDFEKASANWLSKDKSQA